MSAAFRSAWLLGWCGVGLAWGGIGCADAPGQQGGDTATTSAGPAATEDGGPGENGGDRATATTTGAEADATQDASDTTGDTPDAESSDSGSSGQPAVDCDALPRGPFEALAPWRPQPFIGSEDLAFDGLGNLAAKSGDTVRLIDASGAQTAQYEDVGDAYGLRYRASGALLVAHFMTGEIVQLEPDGSRSVFADGYDGVNGLYPDFEDRVWITNFFVVGRINADGGYEEIVGGGDAATANGIVYDADRGFAFFTNYGQGRIRKVAIDAAGAPGAVTDVATIEGASPDGLVLDACGNLYIVDQGESRLYRVMLDEAAEATASPEDLVGGPLGANIANAQFGRGEGFDDRSLYAAGTPGVVYQLELGVGGAPIPAPRR